MTEEQYPKLPNSSRDVLARLTSEDEQHVMLTLEISKEFFSNEQERTRAIEQKAEILVGAAGVAAAILTGIGALLVDPRGVLAEWPLVVVLILFVALAISFFWSMAYALRVLLVGSVHYPGPNVVFEKQDASLQLYRKAHAADVFTAFTRNIDKNNQKAAALRSAQIAFGLFVTLVLLTGLFVISVSLLLDC